MSFCVKYNNGVSDVQDWYGNTTRQQSGKIIAADGYKITGITKAYYGDNNDITYRFRFTKVSDQQYSYTFALKQHEIDGLMNTRDYTVHLNVNTQKIGADPITDLKVTYNNGLSDITDTFTGQHAGTVTGTAKAGTGYTITGITGAKYSMAGGFVTVNLDNFKATKITDTEYSYSFSLTNDNIKDINDNNLTVQLGVETEEQVEPISIDTSGLVHCTVSPTTINPDEETTVTLTADSGYILNGSGTYNADGEETSFTCNNVASYQLTVVADSDISISFTATKITPISIDTSNLKNCTISPATIEHNKETTVTLTADSGYILNGSGTYVADGKSNSFTCNNISSYQITITADSSVSISFTATKVIPTIDLRVTYNNGVSDVTDTFTGQKAGTVAGTAKAGTGYTITEVSGAYYRVGGFGSDMTNFNATKISDYQYSYTFDITNDDISNLKRFNLPVTLDVSTQKQAGTINIDTSGLKNCSVSPSTITQEKEAVLTINADLGYILNGSGAYVVDGKTTNFTCNNVSSYQITVTADSSVSITFTATKTEPKPTSIVHTYVLSQADYNNLGKQVIAGTNSSGTAFEQYDYTKFVNYLYQFPFKIGTNITTSTNTINLGKQNLAIDCQKVTHEAIDIDLGSIDLTGMTNSHDYKPISITLYCPFSNNIALPATVLNSRLDLSFTCNLKSEQATLLIRQNGNIIYSEETNLFTDLPLYFTAGIQDTLIKQLRTSYQNTIKQAYIVISYNKAIADLTSYKTSEHGTLSSYKGFTRVSHGTLKHSVSTSIDNSLLTLLRQGVIIK